MTVPSDDAAETPQVPSDDASEVSSAVSPKVPVDVEVRVPPKPAKTVGDMVRTLAVVGVFILFLCVMVWRPWKHDPVRAVDWKQAAQQAAISKVVPILVPARVPTGWVATSARIDTLEGGYAWQLGFVTNDNQYAAVGVTNVDVGKYFDNSLPGAVQSGSVVIDGIKWTTYEIPGQADHALVNTDNKGITTVVYGTASYSQLTTLLSQLKPAALPSSGANATN